MRTIPYSSQRLLHFRCLPTAFYDDIIRPMMILFTNAFLLFCTSLARALPAETTATITAASTIPSELPSCAAPALSEAWKTPGCTDNLTPACFCSQTDLLPAIASSIQQDCDQDDQNTLSSFAADLCGGTTPTVTASETAAAASTVVQTTAIETSSAKVAPCGTSVSDSTATVSGNATIDDVGLYTVTSKLSDSIVSVYTTTHLSTRTYKHTESGNYTGSLTYSTTAPANPTGGNGTFTGGSAPDFSASKLSLFALIPAVFGMTWIFAEL